MSANVLRASSCQYKSFTFGKAVGIEGGVSAWQKKPVVNPRKTKKPFLKNENMRFSQKKVG